MRTVAQLAELTGINYETVRYYCTPEKPINPVKGKRGRRGAGLIKATSTRGHWNLYDDDALLELAIAGLMGKSGMHIKDMRKALSWDSDPVQLIRKQEARLRKQLAEVDRELRTAGALRRFFEAVENDDDDVFAQSVQEFVLLAYEGLDDRAKKDKRLAPLRELVPTKELTEASKEIESLMKQRRALQRKGGDPEEQRKIDEKIIRVTQLQQGGINSSKDLLEGLIELWEREKASDCEEAGKCIESYYFSQKQLYKNFTLDKLVPYIRVMFTGNYLSLILELANGEGFIGYVIEAANSYCMQRGEKKGV